MMKKLLTLLLALAMCASTASLVACDKEESSDSSPTASTSESESESGTDGDGDEAKDAGALTPTTDFSTLVSNKVTQAQWEAAFDTAAVNNYTVTANFEDEDPEDERLQTIKREGDIALLEVTSFFGQGEAYIEVVGEKSYLYEANGGTIQKRDYTDEAIAGFNYMTTNLAMMCPNFAEHYSSFTYDETKGAYVLSAAITTRTGFGEAGNSGSTFAAGEVTLKFAGDKLAMAYFLSADDGRSVTTTFYDYGRVDITLPTVA